MNVFVDYHHSGLLYSLHLTLEKRFGWKIYRPIGMEWFNRGFWDIAKPYGNNPETVKQFLSLNPNQQPIDGTPPLNNVRFRNPGQTHYRIEDAYHGYDQKAMTFQQFMEADIDIIIGSIPDHWLTYKRLRDQFKPKAKVVAHMGNMFDELSSMLNEGIIDNLMASTLTFQVFTPARLDSSHPITLVNYYQEQPVVPFEPSHDSHSISSYAHVMPKVELYERYKAAMPDYKWRSYGSANSDGWMHTLTDLYASMQQDAFVYHVKPGGDGYGWNWHSAFMLGRPILTNFSDYKDKLGGQLFSEGITGIDLEKRGVAENVALIRKLVDDGTYREMGKQANKRFTDCVNYDHEADKLMRFFSNLI